MCRGGEGGVKGHDRVSGGAAALDTARALAMLRLSGECRRVCPVQDWLEINFTFTKSKNLVLQAPQEVAF